MARDLNLLDSEFQTKVEQVLALCKKDGYTMKPFFTLRSVQEQAKLYRQSRPFSQIQGSHDYLLENGAPFLAQVLMDVGACNGAWATNAMPGFSWHQHGEALDCYWLLNGNAEWSTKKTDNKGENGYTIYAKNAQKLGLEAGHFWTHKDSVHIQKTDQSISKLLANGSWTYKHLDDKMREMFDI